MKKRSLLTSVVVSSVLLGALAFNGCGGSNSSITSEVAKGGLKAGEGASAKATISAGKEGKTSLVQDLTSGSGAVVGTISFSKVMRDDGSCATGCDGTMTTKQDTSCPKVKVAEKDAVLRYTKCYGRTATSYATRKGMYDYTSEMIVYGGALLFKSNDFDGFSAKLFIKGLKCGLEARTEVAAGFANPGHKVFALIKIMDECGNDVKDSQWTEVATMNENGDFTLNLENIDLGDNHKVEILLFSIKNADKTGSTGSTGGSGY